MDILLLLQSTCKNSYRCVNLKHKFLASVLRLLKKGWFCFLKVLLPDLDSFSELAFREFCKFIWQLNIRRSRRTGPARRTHFAISDGSRWRILYHSTCQYIFIRNIKYFMMCCFYSFFIKFGLLQRYCWVLCFHENNFCFENFLELLYLAIM
ncbi:hypothetical protein T4C_934 [Trichinella pseudospiralis]|uniref:Uncharacterized protein n=1 Tax=Trichinella pseudospiralis TaxID=6337 RepID=A0A0V1JSE1_TRIPS|nr:hypothetical protein T4C_934 [Trichinella pseudospiralis]